MKTSLGLIKEEERSECLGDNMGTFGLFQMNGETDKLQKNAQLEHLVHLVPKITSGNVVCSVNQRKTQTNIISC